MTDEKTTGEMVAEKIATYKRAESEEAQMSAWSEVIKALSRLELRAEIAEGKVRQIHNITKHWEADDGV